MSVYSVAEAKNTLPRLIDRALSGEEVIITRHGRAVVELRATRSTDLRGPTKTYDWLRGRRALRTPLAVAISSIDLLDQLHDETSD